MTRKERARMGGLACKENHKGDTDYFRKLGREGGLRRLPSLEEIKMLYSLKGGGRNQEIIINGKLIKRSRYDVKEIGAV